MTQQELEHAIQIYIQLYGLGVTTAEEPAEGWPVHRAAAVWEQIQNER